MRGRVMGNSFFLVLIGVVDSVVEVDDCGVVVVGSG